MPSYLIVLLTILVIVSIIGLIYVGFVFHRIGIVTKKLDYLIEDLTYKSEKLNPAIDAIVKVASYLDILESLLKKDSKQMSSFIKNSKHQVQDWQKTIETSITKDNIDTIK